MKKIKVNVINVAGNRESVANGIQEKTRIILRDVVKELLARENPIKMEYKGYWPDTSVWRNLDRDKI